MNIPKKSLALLLILCLILSLGIIPAAADGFHDVETGIWYHDSIMRWSGAGIINGDGDGSFRPLDNVRRSEFAKIIAETLGLTEQAENIFDDVADNAWYKPYVLACVKAGIINGYEEGDQTLFKADNYITREEAMKVYTVALQLKGVEQDNLSQFSDKDQVAQWAEGFINTILSYGAVNGKSEDILDPKGNIKRCEVAVILDRLAGVYVDQKGTVSTTTKSQYERTGNLVVVHNEFQDEVTLSVDTYGYLTVFAGDAIAKIRPQNKMPATALVSQQVVEVSNSNTITIAPTGEEIPLPETEITLWTYPIGNWSKPNFVKLLIDKFEDRYPTITVKVEYLDYATGDDKVSTALEAGAAPDLILEGPERLVSAWGSHMADLSDIWVEGFYPYVAKAATAADGSKLMYPMAMTVHCMAINKTVFEAAGAMQYIDEETRTWTTENFFKAVQAVYDAGYEQVGMVYCGGQGGDQGTRALVNNLYSGHYTNADHTAYTFDDPANVQALDALADQDGIVFGPTMVGGDEISLFRNGQLQMAFCWNINQQYEDETVNGDEIMFLAFPSDDGIPELQGGVWGFGAFDNGNADKLEAAKLFIRFACQDEYGHTVMLSKYAPPRADQHNYYEGFMLDWEYDVLMKYFGDYYQISPNWSQSRTAWWNMLQEIAAGSNIEEAASEWNAVANEGLN